MREQKQRDKEEEKRRQEAAELKFILNKKPNHQSYFLFLEIIHLLCKMIK